LSYGTQERMIVMKLLRIVALTGCFVLAANLAIAVPPNSDLLDCGTILGLNLANCGDKLNDLCKATNTESVDGVEVNYKNQNDRDSLVSKVVGAAIKYSEGKDERGDAKLLEYDGKLNSLPCYDLESKPKIECGFQEYLNEFLYYAYDACPNA